MFPTPFALVFGFLFDLAVAITLFVLTWGAIQLILKITGLQGKSILKKLCCILFLGLFLYCVILIIFIIIGTLIGPSFVSNFFLSFGLLIGWVVLAAFILGQSIQLSDGRAIGKIKAALIFSGAGLISYLLMGSAYLVANWI